MQSKQHMIVLGVVDRRGLHNCTICGAHSKCLVSSVKKQKWTVGTVV